MKIQTLALWFLLGVSTNAELVRNSLGMDLVKIPSGTFQMGSRPDEKGHQADEEQREVTLTKGFLMGATEVTQKQWMTLMKTSFDDLINKARGPLGRGAKLQSTPSAIGDNEPMCFVNWADAIEFCERLTKQEHAAGILQLDQRYALPTEAQWEYASRGGKQSVFGTGDLLTSKDANFYGKIQYGTSEIGEYREKTIPVSSLPPNSWGLYDMHGNVYEWCRDWYEEKPKSKTDPSGPETGEGRIIRGGAWDRRPESCRSAYRYSRDPNRRSHNIGFRVVIIAMDERD